MNREDKFKMLNEKKYKIIFDEDSLIVPEPYSFIHNDKEYTALFSGVDEEDSRGYIVQQVVLLDDIKPVGYLKVFHIPDSSFDYLYPDVLCWLDGSRGRNMDLDRHPRSIDYNEHNIWENKSNSEKFETLKLFYISFDYSQYRQLEDNKVNIDNIDYDKEYKEMIRIANTKYSKDFKRYKDIHKRAIVEFSRISDPKNPIDANRFEFLEEYYKKRGVTTEQVQKTLDKIEEENLKNNTESPNYQRQGLGLKMYEIMSDYLGLNGIILSKGGTNEMSEPLWSEKISKSDKFNYTKDSISEHIDHRSKDCSYLLKGQLKNQLKYKLKKEEIQKELIKKNIKNQKQKIKKAI